MRHIKALLIILLIIPSLLQANPRQKDWDAVEEAIKKGKPQTAITALETFIPKIIEDKAYPEAIKAICQKISLEGMIEGNKAEEKVFRLEEEIAKVPPAMRPMMQTVLAHWYWQYFQQNRWRFMQRTQTQTPADDDIQTWDLSRILATIDKHFTLALQEKKSLIQIPIADYDFLLETGTVPDRYRPTLYDFIAHEALRFYTTGEQAGASPMDTFAPTADSPLLDHRESFMDWKPETTHTNSPILQAILLYQDLLNLHREDSDAAPTLDIDLHRLHFAYQNAVGPTKKERYQAALTELSAYAKRTDTPIYSRILHDRAQIHFDDEDFVTAHSLATRALKAYPKSLGAKQCDNLIKQIEAKEVRVQIERVWTTQLPDIHISYRNINKLYFRIVPLDVDDFMENQQAYQYMNEEESNPILNKKPIKSWSYELETTTDYKLRTAQIPCPNNLKPGLYYLIANQSPELKTIQDHIDLCPFWISDLALTVQNPYQDNNFVKGLVVHAEKGNPIYGAKVTRYVHGRRYDDPWLPQDTVKTNQNGQFEFKPLKKRSHYRLLVKHQGHILGTQNSFHDTVENTPEKPTLQTIFFTDRSIYRPGQTIHYKGLCIRALSSSGEYQTRPNYETTVVFYDRNRKEIARQKHRSNNYGSFSGSFIAPRDRVLGRMSLQVLEGDRWSRTFFRVEEYKRPKFYVELSPPKDSPKLNTKVDIQGKASAYTGAAIGDGQVKWRVERRATFPHWCWWARYTWPPSATSGQNIAQGTLTTDSDGTFIIPFTAKADPSIPEDDDPTFSYQIVADVTDTSGETRSQIYSLRIGYSALQAHLALNEWQTTNNPVTFTIRTQSLQGQAIAAPGTLAIYQLKTPNKVKRQNLTLEGYWPEYRYQENPIQDDTNPETWALGDKHSTHEYTTSREGTTTIKLPLPAGIYRAVVNTQDRFGRAITTKRTFTVLKPDSDTFPIPIADHLAAAQWSVEPGETFSAIWGTGYNQGQAFIEILCKNKTLKAWWTSSNSTQTHIQQKVTEAMRGGFTLRITYIRENCIYSHQRIVQVPWTNKQLSIIWERFRSKLTPGQKETWTAIIKGPNAETVSAEMLASLYDISLDQYARHHWTTLNQFFRNEYLTREITFENSLDDLHTVFNDWQIGTYHVDISYRHLPRILLQPRSLYRQRGNSFGMMEMSAGAAGGRIPQSAPMDALSSVPMRVAVGGKGMGAKKVSNDMELDYSAAELKENTPPPPSLDLSQVTARKNLQETAFFFPHLVSNKDGEVRMEFTMPEALTEWKFQGFAHDNDMRGGYLTDTVVTAKDLMVQPNPPRFLREGDILEFSVKVSNQSAARQTGQVRLSLSDARTGDSRDAWLGDSLQDQSFDIPSKESRSYYWKIKVPDGGDFLVYKAVAATDRLSDGEEGYLPVLSRRILVTESLPLPIRGKQTKTFHFDKLRASDQSDTLQHQNLTVEMTSQPAWYAVMALPYLMEFPHECSEQTFHRLYANALAQYIAQGNPKIRRIFDQWKGTEALDSPLEKNQDLKAVMIEETPWKQQSINESKARRNVGILFDDNRLQDEINRTQLKLKEIQKSDHLWPWFPGGRGNYYITLRIVTGYGRLRHLGLRDIDVGHAVRALLSLDRWLDERYQHILKHNDPKLNHLNATICLYLYGRSFFLEDQSVNKKYQDAFDYWQGQAKQYWLSQSRLSQGHIAIALKRLGHKENAQGIMESIQEHAKTDEELGMYWRDTEYSWWWYRAPIATQALMIEAFDEVLGNAQAVEDCKVWLLKQKQTQDWKTTIATADAIYALLIRGTNLLSSDALVEVKLGDMLIKPDKVEAGTSRYEQRFIRSEIKTDMGEITVKKVDEGVSWGAVHWQYLEDISKITPYEGTPLKLEKELYIKTYTEKGPILKKIRGGLTVGDELVTRIVLRVDRDMEYIHLKDQRGSGTEPVNVLSRYKYQDGLAYYESTRDTASHFFIDYLPKGTYVFEYSTRVQHRGQYPSGIATIQCMYAPEFNSHSESIDLEVK